MGTLKPNSTYIYERVGSTVYAREAGSDPSTRIIIGKDFESNSYYRDIADKYFMETEWAKILKAARTNSTLQEAIDRVKILYHLSENNGQE